MKWQIAQNWEKNWHGDCVNSYTEETKQIVYARKMGLVAQLVAGKWPVYDLGGKTVLDIGGGPYSMLLKCVNFSRAAVFDPLKFPSWVRSRYRIHGIIQVVDKAERLIGKYDQCDEVWIYNVLQHTDDPEKIIANAKNLGKLIRLFEWIETETNVGHIHNLTKKDLDRWLGGEGRVELLNESGCVGQAYYGVFKGKFYEKAL